MITKLVIFTLSHKLSDEILQYGAEREDALSINDTRLIGANDIHRGSFEILSAYDALIKRTPGYPYPMSDH